MTQCKWLPKTKNVRRRGRYAGVLTVNIQRDSCFETLTFRHGTIPHDATVFRAVVFTFRCHRQSARCLAILRTTFANWSLQRHRAAFAIPTKHSKEMEISMRIYSGAPFDGNEMSEVNRIRLIGELYLRYGWIGWTANAAARQIEFLLFSGRCDVARRYHWGLRRRQYGDVVVFLMDIGTGTNRFDATLKSSIVPIIRCVLNPQIVSAAIRLKVDSENEKNVIN